MTLFAEISAEGWVLIVTAVGGAMTSVLGTVFSYLSKRRAEDAEVSSKVNAAKIDAVTETLKQQDLATADVKGDLLRSQQAAIASTKALGKKVDRVHSLVNGPHTALVADKAAALRRLAALSRDPADARAADEAERDLGVRRVVEAREKAAADPTAEVPAPPPGK